MAKSPATPEEQKLQEQVESLREDIKNIAASLKNVSSQKVDQAKNKAGNLYESAKENSEEMLNEAKDQFKRVESQLCTCVREKPVASLAAAAGIGFVLALLLRK